MGGKRAARQPWPDAPAGVLIDGVAVNAKGQLAVTLPGYDLVESRPPGGGWSALTGGSAVPMAVAADAVGDVYVADSLAGRVTKLGRDGTSSVLGFQGLSQPGGVAVDASGDVFVADSGTQRIVELTPGGVQTSVDLASSPLQGQPISMAVDASGDVYFLGSKTLYELAPHGQPVDAAPPGLVPTAVAADPSGNMFVLSSNQGYVELGSAAPPALHPMSSLNQPMGMAVDAAGEVFVADPGQNAWMPGSTPTGAPQVVEETAAGTQQSEAFSGLVNPVGVAVDGAGDLVVADTLNQVSMLPVTTATFTNLADGQANVDTNKPLTWTTPRDASAYYLEVGTAQYTGDQFGSGDLPGTQSSSPLPTLPVGETLYATLFTEVNGVWSYQEASFSAAQGEALFTYPTSGSAAVDTTKPFTWSTIPKLRGTSS